VSRIVVPSERRFATSSHERRRAEGSKPVVGSVQEEELGVAGDAEGEVESAALASGERSNPCVALVLEPDELRHLVDGERCRVRGAVELNRLADGELAVRAAFLRDDADALAK
jgi:hypothetical protein